MRQDRHSCTRKMEPRVPRASMGRALRLKPSRWIRTHHFCSNGPLTFVQVLGATQQHRLSGQRRCWTRPMARPTDLAPRSSRASRIWTCLWPWEATHTPPDQEVRTGAESECTTSWTPANLDLVLIAHLSLLPPRRTALSPTRARRRGRRSRPSASTARPRIGRGALFAICAGMILRRVGGTRMIAAVATAKL
jgi:hypothetical protein